MIRKRLIAVITLTSIVALGLTLPASAAQASPNCDRPNPPPICQEQPPPPDPGVLSGTAVFSQEAAEGGAYGNAYESNNNPVWVDLKVDGVVRRTVTPGQNGWYNVSAPITPVTASVCAVARSAFAAIQLGCWQPHSPVGEVTFTYNGSTTVVSGWVIDPDTTGPVTVTVGSTPYTANQPRADIGALYPSYGAYHGFSVTFPYWVGCYDVIARNIGIGSDNWLALCLT
ncbi:hypothetical protein ACFPIJ_26025 [Dactylosporangium cerinum]|uniref:Secreted protein n=1 Tax=Dactylosporangium cerinum TaxID=1434730 RepID=A0ABV9VYV6_9ACTN